MRTPGSTPQLQLQLVKLHLSIVEKGTFFSGATRSSGTTGKNVASHRGTGSQDVQFVKLVEKFNLRGLLEESENICKEIL